MGKIKEILTKTKPKSLSTMPDYGKDVGSGFEDTKGSDLSVPFLIVLQSNSPQVTERDPKEAESGMIYNTVTRELVGGQEGVVFLPCHKEGPVWVEWVPRNKGGGFVAIHEGNSPSVKGADSILHPETGKPTRKLRLGENELVETFYMYGLLLEDDEEGESTKGFAVISFTSTKIKPFRDWVTAMYTMKGKPPLFANRARISTVKQQNDSGNYYNFRVDPLKSTWVESLINPKTQKALLEEAKGFREMVASGMARGAFETQQSVVDGDSNEGVPF